MTLVLVSAVVGVYVYQWFAGSETVAGFAGSYGLLLPEVLAAFRRFGVAVDTGAAAAGLSAVFADGVVPLLVYPFLHSGPIHAVTNAMALFVFGSRMEARTSWWRLLLFFVCCSVFAGAVELQHGVDREVVHLGATAPIAALGLGYLLFYPKARIQMLALPLPIFIELPAVILFAIWGALQFHKVQDFFGLGCGVSLGYTSQVVACLVGGLILTPLILGKRRKVPREKKPKTRKSKKGKKKR